MQAISHSSVVCMRLKQMMWPGKRRLVNNIPLFSIFIFQTLSDKQLLPEHNLNQCSFWETYLTTSDLQHEGWTYFSYLFCSRNYLGRAFIFPYCWNFEHKLRSTFLWTQHSFLKDPPRTQGLCQHSSVSAYPGPWESL